MYTEMWERNREALKKPHYRRIDTEMGINRILMTPILFSLMVEQKFDNLENEIRTMVDHHPCWDDKRLAQ